MRTLPAWALVAQLFNHQTHHRGQLTTLISPCGIDPGVTDISLQPEFDAAVARETAGTELFSVASCGNSRNNCKYLIIFIFL